MAKNKNGSQKEKASGSKTNQVSVKAVSRGTASMMRRERKANPSMRSILAKLAYRQNIEYRAKKDPKAREIQSKYDKEEAIKERALDLFNTYGPVGAQWGACVEAVKTDWISQFQSKWGEKLHAAKKNKEI